MSAFWIVRDFQRRSGLQFCLMLGVSFTIMRFRLNDTTMENPPVRLILTRPRPASRISAHPHPHRQARRRRALPLSTNSFPGRQVSIACGANIACTTQASHLGLGQTGTKLQNMSIAIISTVAANTQILARKTAIYSVPFRSSHQAGLDWAARSRRKSCRTLRENITYGPR
ncbi:hypothetical protein FA95DRAFT_984403 [Auriscalpium vulgare]|uniref:Uncharacterized protein n=1 Tax=Auriscalpium vulgare TaxID=40419 RepID=A0ACB8R6L6_9AGAM|nr:hypothetical protein FA95DRAFT_984403 [Auriscalpium vulgare]